MRLDFPCISESVLLYFKCDLWIKSISVNKSLNRHQDPMTHAGDAKSETVISKILR